MPQDKSIISLPSTSKFSVLPNVATNVQQVKYNEGLYVSDSSLKATYPKSVIRIYKNPNNPKKVYFAAKDTSLLENYVFNLVNKGATKDSDPNTFRTSAETAYYWSRTETEKSYRDFSVFSQPYNLNLETSDVIGKKLNFYTLPIVSQQVLYLSGLNSDSEINLNFKEYNIFLKAKSYITDYQNYDSFKSNKAKRAEASDVGGAEQPTVDKAALYQKFLFNQLTGSSDIESDLNSIKPLSESELQLNKSVQITNINKIKFSDFVEASYEDENGLVFLNDDSIPKDRTNTSNKTHKKVKFDKWIELGSNYGQFTVLQVDQIEESSTVFKWFVDKNLTDLNDIQLKSLFKDRYVAIKKKNLLIDTITDQQLIKPLSYGDSTSYEFGPLYYYVEKDNDIFKEYGYYSGSIGYEKNKMFNLNKELYLNTLFGNYENYSSVENADFALLYNPDRSTDETYFRSYDEPLENILATTYFFDKSFNYSDYGFLATDLDETIYEFELDQELDYENGTYIVAEIE